LNAKNKERRFVVTISKETEADTDVIAAKLARYGFRCVDKLPLLGCLLGDYAGQTSDLESVEGVISVEEEGTMSSQ